MISKTVLKKLIIQKFRALKNVEIEFGEHITVICGKNGTSKSSILGIIAQIFNFQEDYTKSQAEDKSLNYRTIFGTEFKSKYSDHFRFSSQYDVSGSMEVKVELFDGYTEQNATAELTLTRRGNIPRPVVRKNSTAIDSNTSRNFTHPVIYLSLKRLFPISDRDYKIISYDYNQNEFIQLSNKLLNRTSNSATSTTGTINSTVAHGSNYDQDSVSAGEDNAGQIILALMSFRRLKETYSEYKGGLLLIDEADAGLFPAAQIKLIEILLRECNLLNIQVVMTSHSPTLIEDIFDKSKKFRKQFKTVYLSDSYGSLQAMHDFSWLDIYADLHTKTIKTRESDTSLPKINVYFEDREGYDLFRAIMNRHPANQHLCLLDKISLGCTNYINLVKNKVTEFSKKSIICLDADVNNVDSYPSIILLPGSLPPDQLIFEYLYNMPANHKVWTNNIRFTRPVFTQIASDIIEYLCIKDDKIDLKLLISQAQNNQQAAAKKPRDMFKQFYKNDEFQTFLNSNKIWQAWKDDNIQQCEQFILKIENKLKTIMHKEYGVDMSKLSVLNKKKSKY